MVANLWASGHASPSYSLAFGTPFFNGVFVSGAVIRETMKQPAFTETRCGLLRSDGEREVGGKHAPKKQFLPSSYLFFFLKRAWSPCQESIFFLCACFFMSPEEITDESWPDHRNHTGAELGQSLNKQVLFFRNCWKHSSPLPLGWNRLPCSTRAVAAALAGGHILLDPEPGRGGSGSPGSSPRCPSSAPPHCLLFVFPLLWFIGLGSCGCFLAECS